MRTTVRRGLGALAIAGGISCLGFAVGSPAMADQTGPGIVAGGTSGDDGIVSGNQTGVEVLAPVDASGNQVTVIGDGNSSGGSTDSGSTGADGAGSGGDAGSTSGEDGA